MTKFWFGASVVFKLSGFVLVIADHCLCGFCFEDGF